MSDHGLIILDAPTVSSGKVLWVDDDLRFRQRAIPQLAKKIGLDVDFAENYKEASSKIKQNGKYSFFCLDLDLGTEHDKSGIDLYKVVRKHNQIAPVSIVSAKLGFEDWSRRIEELSKELSEQISTIDKVIPIVRTKTNNKFSEISIRKITYEKITQNPFSLTLEEFFSLTDDQLDSVFENAARLTQSARKNIFDKEKISWFVCCQVGDFIRIVDSGSSEKMLDEEYLMSLAKKYNCPVFAYKKPIRIEDLGRDGHWDSIDQSDYYPTITFQVSDTRATCHLDTGSPASFVSYKYFKKINAVSRNYLQIAREDKIFGRLCRFYDRTIVCELWDESDIFKQVLLSAAIVRNWEEVFCTHYKKRIGLIGRSFLIENKLTIELSGKNLTSKVIWND